MSDTKNAKALKPASRPTAGTTAPSVRPFVTLKIASSLDGRIALANGESRWITNDIARQNAHRLRAAHDAIAVGVNTVLADDPMLNVRLPEGDGPPITRVVFDRECRTPLASALVRSARSLPVVILCGPTAPDYLRAPLTDAGVTLCEVPARGLRGVEVCDSLEALHKLGIRRLMVEGGGQLLASFFAAALWDELHWYRANCLLGADARPVLGALGLESLKEAPRLRLQSTADLGGDRLEVFHAAP